MSNADTQPKTVIMVNDFSNIRQLSTPRPTIWIPAYNFFTHPVAAIAYNILYNGSGMKSPHKRYKNVLEAQFISLAFRLDVKQSNFGDEYEPTLDQIKLENMLGMAMCCKGQDGTYWVNEVISAPDQRGQGYGASAMQRLVWEAKKLSLRYIYLICNPAKQGAKRPLPEYYAQFGFMGGLENL